MTGPTRVLVVLDDTSTGELNDRALALHRKLTEFGAQVRTVAMGPGGDGALDVELPVLGPSPGSLAAALQLRRESHWADLVVCAGRRCARAQRLAGARRSAAVQLIDGRQSSVDDVRSSLHDTSTHSDDGVSLGDGTPFEPAAGLPGGRARGRPRRVAVAGVSSADLAREVLWLAAAAKGGDAGHVT
ncbi:MAG: hypothetical protein ACK5O2_12065 [Microthrixaceae bacterium]